MLSATFTGCCRSRVAVASLSSRISFLSSTIRQRPGFYNSGQNGARPFRSATRGLSYQQGSKESSKDATKTDMTFLQRYMAPTEMPPRGTLAWYGEMVLICTVFAITGTSTMMLVRPAVKNVLHLDGSFKDGPWSYRIASLVVMSPIYSILLVVVGTVFGRHAYFRFFSVKMLSRFGIPPELMDKEFHATKKTFKKW